MPTKLDEDLDQDYIDKGVQSAEDYANRESKRKMASNLNRPLKRARDPQKSDPSKPDNPNIKRGGLGVPNPIKSTIQRGGFGQTGARARNGMANRVVDSGIDKAGKALAAETGGASIVAAEIVKRHKRETLILLIIIIIVILLPFLFVFWLLLGDNTQSANNSCTTIGSQTAQGELSTAEYMNIYGHTPAEVEANLVTINFQGHDVKVHKLVKDVFEKVNNEITQANTGYAFRSIGTYAWRQKNCPSGCSGLSTHSFGITMDINPDTNPYTSADTHDMPPAVVDIFKQNGFAWGGDWQPHDWMHFQYEGGVMPAGAGVASASASGTTIGTQVASGAAGGVGAVGTQTTGSSTGCSPSSGGSAASYLPPVMDACGGKYRLNNPINQNFGDPDCKFNKDDLIKELQSQDAANADRWISIIQCESSFNPNAFNGNGTPDPGGAWGLFQDGHSFPPGQPPTAPGQKAAGGPTREYDRGDTVWRLQVSNAVNLAKGLSSLGSYWACAR